MPVKLVAIGDSLTQGFQHGAIRRTHLSYPAIVAKVLGEKDFRQADFSGAGTGGPLVDLELLVRLLSKRFGARLDWWDAPGVVQAVQSFTDHIEDYWERGDGTKPAATGPIHHNLAVWGFEVLDASTLSDQVCAHHIPAPEDNLLDQVPEHGMYRTARRVLNPQQQPGLAALDQILLAERLAGEAGGIENLVVALGSNNALDTCLALDIKWSTPEDFHRLAHERACTLWKPAHFRELYRELATRIARVKADRVFLATIPHVTVAPVTRGVSPGKRGDPNELLDNYYEYYTHFWIWDDDFDPDLHDHLTRAQVMEIDRTIDQYNLCIREIARANQWHIIDLCGLLDELAFRRNKKAPPYRLPDALVQALKDNEHTSFRVRDDGVLLDTRYMWMPGALPDDAAAIDVWRDAVKGGLFGLDGVHPTTIGYGLIAHEVLVAMEKAGVAGANPSRLPWDDIVVADTLVTEPPAILSSLQRTLDVLFGKLSLDRTIRNLAGAGKRRRAGQARTPEPPIEQAKEVRALLLSALAALVFAAISASSLRDCELLTDAGKIQLPLLGVEVPVRTFFVVLPVLLLCVFVYVNEQLERLAEKVKVVAHEQFPVWPLSELPFPRGGPGRILSIVTQLVVWGMWPVVAVAGAWLVFPLKYKAITAVNIVAALAAMVVSTWYWRKIARPARLKWSGLVKAGAATCFLASGAFVWSDFAQSRHFTAHYSDFKQADLTSFDFGGRDVTGADFRNATLGFANFCGAGIDGSSFRGAKARKAAFVCRHSRDEVLSRLDFSDADLSLVNLSQATLDDTLLGGATLTDANFWRCLFRPGTDHRRNTIDLSHTTLTGANLSEIVAKGADFTEATARYVDFFKAHLEGATFNRASLEQPNFTGAFLAKARFPEASIRGARLRGADLTGADLGGCDLTDVDFNASTTFDGASCDQFTKASDELKARLGGCTGAKPGER